MEGTLPAKPLPIFRPALPASPPSELQSVVEHTKLPTRATLRDSFAIQGECATKNSLLRRSAVTVASVILSGDATTSSVPDTRILDVQTMMGKTISLDPAGPDRKTVFMKFGEALPERRKGPRKLIVGSSDNYLL